VASGMAFEVASGMVSEVVFGIALALVHSQPSASVFKKYLG